MVAVPGLFDGLILPGGSVLGGLKRHITGAKARFVGLRNVGAKARTYLRSNEQRQRQKQRHTTARTEQPGFRC